MIFVGIDPGKNGGISFINEKGESCSRPMPSDEFDLAYLLENLSKNYEIAHALIEKAQAHPKQGVVSMFNYGVGFGQLIGVCATLDIPFTLVNPKLWMKEMHRGTSVKLTSKKRSLLAAKRLFPKEKFLATTRSKVPHDGMYESLLIAEYCRRIIK